MTGEIIDSLVADAYGTAAEVVACEQLKDERRDSRFRTVYRVTLKERRGPTVDCYAKIGNDGQTRKEFALFHHVLEPGITSTPVMLAAYEQDGVFGLLIESARGVPCDPSLETRLSAAMGSVATLHAHCRPKLEAVSDVLKPAPYRPEEMFDRLRAASALWDRVGLTDGDLAVFYEPRILDLMHKDLPTLVHGDLSDANVFVNIEEERAVFIDFGMAMVLPSTAEFMYFPDAVISEQRLERALRIYTDHADSGISFEERRICQLYWHGSYYADCLVSEFPAWDHMNEEARRTVRGFLDRVRYAGQGILAATAA